MYPVKVSCLKYPVSYLSHNVVRDFVCSLTVATNALGNIEAVGGYLISTSWIKNIPVNFTGV